MADFCQIASCPSELRFTFLKALVRLCGAPGWLLAALETPGRPEGEFRTIFNWIENVSQKAKLVKSNSQNSHDAFYFAARFELGTSWSPKKKTANKNDLSQLCALGTSVTTFLTFVR